MAGNTFGKILRLTTFGESHGRAVGGVLDGFPAGVAVDTDFLQKEVDRRRPAATDWSSQRHETDEVELLSGVFEGQSLGTPIAFLVWNKDQRSTDYDHLRTAYRPSHADFTYEKKYGIRDHRGGGRASARETLARVIGGALAKMLLQTPGVEIHAFVSRIGQIALPDGFADWDPLLAEQSPVRCPHEKTSEAMEKLLRKTKAEGDTLGGEITCVVKNVPAGWGEPVFDKMHAELGKAMLSINAVKGFSVGSGFAAARMKGSEHNDLFELRDGKTAIRTNFSGGIQGGITNGEDIYFSVAFKPVATLMRDQQSLDASGKTVVLEAKGRHDVCVVPRAVPIVEAMAALVLADHLLQSRLSRW